VNRPTPEALTRAQLSAEADVSRDRVDWLERIGILEPPAPGRFGTADVFRVKMIAALLEAGFSEEDVEWAVSRGSLDLSHVGRFLFLEPAARSSRSFAEFSECLAEHPGALPGLYEVLGLPKPDPSSSLRQDEEELLEDFFRAWSLASDDETLIRAARLVGEGTRTAAMGWPDLFEEQVAARARERFARREVEDFPPEVIEAGVSLVTLLPRLMGWLTQRYVEQRIVAGIVENFEEVLAAGGRARAAGSAPARAVVFADLSGYTRISEEHGDDVAVGIAASLQRRAEAVAMKTGGRLVKLLGDGAMLYFRDPERGVEAGAELVTALGAELGLPAHAGVHVGPVIERDRDIFGRTVNLASRIAATAGPGEVIVSEEVVGAVATDGLRFERVGETELKGLAEPVTLYRVIGEVGPGNE
jgi:class 3 adenylate cyclase